MAADRLAANPPPVAKPPTAPPPPPPRAEAFIGTDARPIAAYLAVGHAKCGTSRPLVTGLERFDRGFGLAARFKNCIACKRDGRRVGLRHPVNNGACLR